MTLDTRVAITSPVPDPRSVFDFCNELLAAASGWDVSQIAYKPFEPGVNQWHTNAGWHNDLGQGLSALMDVKYGADGGPILRDCYAKYDHEDAIANGEECSLPPCFVEVSFDTAYGYTSPSGLGCGDLHAALVAALGSWLDNQGLEWSWYNEFQGKWYVGHDSLEGLGRGGTEATEWFSNVAWPAIQADIATRET